MLRFTGPSSIDIALARSKAGQLWRSLYPKFGWSWNVSSRVRPMWGPRVTNFVRTSAKFGEFDNSWARSRCWPNLDQICPGFDQLSTMSIEVGQGWPGFDYIRAISAECGSLAKFGSELTNFGRVRPMLTRVGQSVGVKVKFKQGPPDVSVA